MSIHIVETTENQRKFMDRLKAALCDEHDYLSPIETLAITAQFLGYLTAIQEPEYQEDGTVAETITRNIQLGNKIAVESFFTFAGSA